MRRHVVVAWLLAVIALALPQRVAAQAADDDPRWEVSGAYTYLRDPRTDLALPHGWLAGVARRAGRIWMVAEADRSARDLPLLVGDARITMTSLFAGVRMGAHAGPFREFAHVLVGQVRVGGVFFGVEDGESRLAVQPGIGIEYPVGRFAARLALDARGIQSDDGSWVSQLRGAAGLTYSFR